MKMFQKEYNNFTKIKKKKYFWGIIKTIKSPTHKNYFLLGLHIATKEMKNYKEVYYLRTPNLFKYNNIKKGLKQIIEQAPSEYDSIYYISAPTGEGYILANILPDIIEQNHSKNPYILLRNEGLSNIFDIFCPTLKNKKVYKLWQDLNFRQICKHKYFYKGKNIYIFFPTKHYYLQDCKIIRDKTNNTHFFNYICESLKVKTAPASFNIKNLNVSEDSLYEKIKDLNLNLDKFVIFAPEANTSVPYSEDFYTELAQILKENGYDIFWNLTSTKYLNDGITTVKLSYDELFLLAMKSKGVIGLRSGLFDILSCFNEIPKFVLYTEFPDRGKKAAQYYTSSKALAGFSLKKLPNVDKNSIYEFDTNLLNSKEIAKRITDTLTGA